MGVEKRMILFRIFYFLIWLFSSFFMDSVLHRDPIRLQSYVLKRARVYLKNQLPRNKHLIHSIPFHFIPFHG